MITINVVVPEGTCIQVVRSISVKELSRFILFNAPSLEAKSLEAIFKLVFTSSVHYVVDNKRTTLSSTVFNIKYHFICNWPYNQASVSPKLRWASLRKV